MSPPALPAHGRGPLVGTPAIVVVLKGYPRVSETFVAHELAGLERRGLRLGIVSLRRPYDRITHPVHAAIRAPVWYLPEYLLEAPGTVLRSHLRLLTRAPRRYLATAGIWLRDLARDPTVNRVRRFGQAGVLAAGLPRATRHLHAHFLHTPASVTRYAARMRGISFSLSGHAKDVWTVPDWELREKLGDARFTVTCTDQNRRRLRALGSGKVELVYHGLDRALFAPPAEIGSARDGRDPSAPVRLLAVGRLQPKKGFATLLRAVARVRRHVGLTVVGYGPLEAELRDLAADLGLTETVRFAGALDQPAVRALYRASDLFVLAPAVVADGDRDGLPNVVVEALSQGLPVVATRVAAIPEIVDDGVHGRLVPPDDPAALAAAIEALVTDPGSRQRMGRRGLETVARGWDVEAGVDRLVALLLEALGPREAAEAAAPGSVAGARLAERA